MDVDSDPSPPAPSEVDTDFPPFSGILASPFLGPQPTPPLNFDTSHPSPTNLSWQTPDATFPTDLPAGASHPPESLSFNDAAFIDSLIDLNLDSTTAPQPAPSTAPFPAAPADEHVKKPFVCDDCGKRYEQRGRLDKHLHNHTKRRKCPVDGCRRGGAENKDLYRHLWSKHEDYARAYGIPRESEKCDKCDYRGRKDNVKRHKRLKHGVGVA